MSTLPLTDSAPPSTSFGHVSARPGRAALSATAVACATLAYAAAIQTGIAVFGPLFEYLAYRTPDPLLHGAVLVLMVLSCLMMPRRLIRPSDTALWIIHASAALPAVIGAQVLTLLTPREAFTFAVHILGAMTLARVITVVLPRAQFGTRLNRSGPDLWILLTCFAVVVYALLIVVAGARPTYVGVLDVYGLRSEFDTRLAAIPMMGYLLPLLHNIVNPLLATRGIFTRNWALLGIGLGGQVLVFLLAGQKGVLFSTVFLIGFAFLYRGNRIPSGAFLLTLLAVSSFGALLVDRLTGTLYAGSVYVRRFLILPGALIVAYVAIFTKLPQTQFADSLLRFMDNPYAVGPSPARIVGLQYIGHAETNANVSFLGHGYLSWGYLGMYVEAAVVGLTLWAVDRAAVGLPPKVCGLLMVMPAVTLSSASAFTSILTHGLAGLVLLLALAPRDDWAPRRQGAPLDRPPLKSNMSAP